MATLNTFGAVLSHAIAMEAQLEDWYSRIGEDAQAKAAAKRRKMLERVRRENVVEITLEPIEGLDAADYQLDLADAAAARRVAARFYQDAAPKINVRSAQRALERCGKQHLR